ncbi:hypothetical protein [Natronorubrum sp. DTA7]|uniref:hypothetical protein n=1 Tax=Natronorubrum sp. DTA7 TaxID=3447016 RepID=UPI003F869A35
MNRALAVTLTVAMVGGLLFIGAAGSAAAQDINVNTDAITGGDGGDGGDAAAATVQNFDQTNQNAQVGAADSTSTAESYAVGSGADSAAGSSSAAVVAQNQNVNQGNAIEANATTIAIGGDGGDGGDAGVDVGIDLDLLLAGLL